MEEVRVINIRIEVEDDTSLDSIEDAIGDALNDIGCDCTFDAEEVT